VAQPPAISSTKLATRSAARGALPDARIERAVTRLAQRGDPRAVIALVERWSQTGEPTPRARLAQVRAFLDLAMTDRAWTRLQDGADASPVDRAGADPAASDPLDAEARLDGLRLTARMFLDRGWPKRAIPVLDASLALAPDDAELLALRARAEQPARRPPPDDAVPADAPAAERLALAEACLATGAFLRARRLLEQLTAAPPTDPTHAARADDLLWALRGDYDVAESLADLVAAAEDPDLAPEQDEHTSATAHLGPRPARPSPAPHRPAGEPALDPADLGVPDLFGMAAPASEGVPDGALGGARPGEAPEAPGEVTQATRMLDLRSGEGALGGGDRDEDTQVLRVFATPGASTEAPVAAPARPATTTEGVEREDEAVVQLTDAAAALPPPKVALPLPIPTPPRPSGSPDAPHDAPGGPRAEPMVLLDDAQIDPLEDDPLLPGWAKLALAGLILGALALVAAAYLGASSP
jgi:hypothetical protein